MEQEPTSGTGETLESLFDRADRAIAESMRLRAESERLRGLEPGGAKTRPALAGD
jgi:hypothetical protein